MDILEKVKENKWIVFFKEYLSLLVAVPYIIGGAKQMLILGDLSIDLLKFFSLSQLLIDGIITFLFLFSLIVCMEIYKAFAALITNHTEHPEKRLMIIYTAILVLIVLCLMGIGFCYLTYDDQKKFFLKYGKIIILGVGLIMLNLSIILKSKTKKSFLYLGSIIFVSTIFTSKLNNIQNFDNTTLKVKKEFKDAQLEYFNDQYLFYKTDPIKENSKILVLKIDDIFK